MMRKFDLLQFILIAFCIIHTGSSIKDDLSERQKFNNNKNNKQQENFLIIDHLNDNEKETRIKWRDLMGKETTLDLDGDERYANSSFNMLSLWQVSDGQQFAQLIFNKHELVECEFLKNGREFAQEFTDNFIDEYNLIQRRMENKFFSKNRHQYYESSNIKYHEQGTTYDDIENIKPNATLIYLQQLQDIPEYFLNLLHLHALEYKCNQLHEEVKQKIQLRTLQINNEYSEIESIRNSRMKRQAESWFIAPETRWCGKGRSAESYKELGPSKSDVCCRKHDHCRLTIQSFRSKYGLFNHSPFTMSHCRCDRSKSRRRHRHKRDLNNFMIPYTKWCGKGWSAKKYSEIGGFSRTDKCCRSHDYCPHWIGSFEQKWSLFNWSINVIMHCRCDERFRTCLKMADAADANIVGKLFFNFMQIKCFVLKPEKTCILNSWWGKCLKFKTKKKAYLRDNKKY